MKKISLFCLFFLLSFINTNAQSSFEIDSLRNILDNSSSDSLAHFSLEMASLYYHLDRDSSFFYSKKALAFATENDDYKNQARANINIALIKIENNQNDEAAKLLKDALPMALNAQDTESIIMAYANLGTLNHYNADYEIAVNYYLRAREYAIQSDNKYEISRINYNIADVFNQNKITNKSNQYYRLAMKSSKSAFPIIYVLSCLQIADHYSDINQDSASLYFENAFDLEDQIDAPQILLEMYSGKGGILAKYEKYAAAQLAYLQSLEYAKQLNQDYYLASCYCNLGEIETYLGKYNKGSEYFKLYQKHQSKTENDYVASRCLLAWSTLEKEKGNFKQSYELLYKRAEISIF